MMFPSIALNSSLAMMTQKPIRWLLFYEFQIVKNPSPTKRAILANHYMINQATTNDSVHVK